MANNLIDISVVVPAFDEAENLPTLFERLKAVLQNLGVNYEIIVVDDGSTDNTVEILEQAHSSNNNIKFLSFSRNFGHQAALNAGLDYTQGNAIVIMDADMQQPPELIVDLYAVYKQGYEIVLGIRTSNEQNSWAREKIGRLFYSLMNKLSKLNLQPNVADFGLFDVKVINALRQMPEKDRFLRGLIQWVGFNKKFVEYEASVRQKGKSKYNFRKLLSLGISGITSFSAFPLRLSWWVGTSLFIFSLFYALYVIIDYLFISENVPAGWASLIVFICVLNGFHLMMLGVIGEYLFRIFNEDKNRPLYIIKEKSGFSGMDIGNNSKYGISVDR